MYRHQLDESDRIRIPAKLKKRLGENYFVMKGFGGCLFIIAEEEAERLIFSKLDNIPLSDDEGQRPLTLLSSSAVEGEEDSQGRLGIPKHLREYAGIKKNVVSIGAINHVEIWAEESYEKRYPDEDQNNVLKGLAKFGI